jgi:hypothetical protein
MAVESLHIFTEYNSEQPMDDLKYPEWQNPFREALLEIDCEKLQSKMMKAEEAIFQRLQQLAGTSGSEAERQAIEDAISALRVLKREKLNYPDWESV